MNGAEACTVYIRNWVPGLICPSSNDCDSGRDCKQPSSKLTALYCQRALLARKIEFDITTAVRENNLVACHKAMRTARDQLAPMMSDGLRSEADSSSRVGKNLVKLVNSFLGE